MEDSNRSTRKTMTAIKNIFLNLIEEKPYYKISVSKITERADISRSTFYLHYSDIYDLLQSIEKEVLSDVEEVVKKIKREKYVPGQHPQHTSVFEILYKHEYACKSLLSKNGDIEFLRKLEETIASTLCRSWERYCGRENDTPNIRMFSTYIAFGIIGIFSNQIKSGENVSIEEMGYFAGEVTNWIDESFVRKV